MQCNATSCHHRVCLHGGATVDGYHHLLILHWRSREARELLIMVTAQPRPQRRGRCSCITGCWVLICGRTFRMWIKTFWSHERFLRKVEIQGVRLQLDMYPLTSALLFWCVCVCVSVLAWAWLSCLQSALHLPLINSSACSKSTPAVHPLITRSLSPLQNSKYNQILHV